MNMIFNYLIIYINQKKIFIMINNINKIKHGK